METIKVYKSISNHIRDDLSYNERWGSFEQGLVTAWESGKKHKNDTFSFKYKLLQSGALPKLSFKGGHIIPIKIISYKINRTKLFYLWDKDRYKDFFKPKYKYKYGTFNYIAQMQGILGKDLDIDSQRDEGMILTCSITSIKTIFTTNIKKYKDNKTFNARLKNELTL